jgi:hypothetical protein
MIRLYGHQNGEGSFVQVTRGMARAVEHAGQLAGVVPIDDLTLAERCPHADAPIALSCGVPTAVRLAHAMGLHRQHWLLLAPNSNGVPPSLRALLQDEKLTGLLAPGRWAQQVLERAFPELPVLLAPHGVTPGLHQASGDAHALRWNEYAREEFRVVHMTSTAGKRKSTRPLIQAWSRLMSERTLPPRATLTISANPLTVAAHQWDAHGCPSITVRPATGLPPRLFVQVLQLSHLIAQPSRAEGFGLVPLEALACGTPVLATQCTGHEYLSYASVTPVEHGPDVPSDDYPGATAPTVTSEAIESGLLRAYSHWQERSRLAQAEAKRLCEVHAWEHTNRPAIDEMLKHLQGEKHVQ